MAGFLNRIFAIFKSSAPTALDNIEGAEKLINQMITDIEDQLTEARRDAASSIAAEKRLKKQINDSARQSEMWELKAVRAVEAENDKLAKRALERKKEYDDTVARLKPQWDSARETADKLKTQLRRLQSKIEQMKRKRDTIIARQKVAEAQNKIQSAVAAIGENNAFETFARMEEKVAEIEAQGRAQERLRDEFSDDALTREFTKLESTSIDDKLAALKAKVGK